MPAMRFSPEAGYHLVSEIACMARLRNVPPPGMSLSIAANHCGVARKITGARERHECG